MASKRSKREVVEAIIRATAEEFKIDPMAIMATGHSPRVVTLARHVCFAFIQSRLDLNYTRISGIFRRTADTSKNGIDRVVRMMAESMEFREQIDRISCRIGK